VPDDVVAVGQWALITPNAGLAEPDYLAWILNHPVTSARLGRVMKGGTLPFLPLSEVRAFAIAVPSLETQRRIVRVDALHARVSLLERELADARTLLVNAATMNALHHAADSVGATHS
jgi:restriction endonuclease S subunit